MSHIIIGTAGHIDHGKTALVKALTGIDTDRLKEEKERGLTIDLGFAHLGDRATIIDVPGHEKFIRNMVAGVSTIDLVIFVVAADDGVMPQTREHLDILKILQVKNGLIVITKKDLVESDWLELVKDDIRKLTKGSFLENAPIHTASALTGDGVSEIKAEIEQFFKTSQLKTDRGLFWMPIDRAFVMKGFGTVVTGSVLSGRINEGEQVDLLPLGLNVRVRGLQSHDKKVKAVSTGDRAAINLQAVEKQQIQRGDVLAAPGYFKASTRFDARLQLLESAPRALKNRARVRVHVGTSEVMARLLVFGVAKIEPGAEAFVQLQLENPAAARRLDAFVIRQYSPTITIGGGVILNSNAERHKLSDPTIISQLQALEKENPVEVLESRLLSEKLSLITLEQLSSDLAISKDTMTEHIHELEKQGKAILLKKAGQDVVIHKINFETAKVLSLETMENFHQKNPAKPGLPKAGFKDRFPGKIDLELLKHILDALIKDGEIVDSGGSIALKSHKITLSPEQVRLREKIKELLYEGAFSPPSEIDIAERLNVSLKPVQQVLTLMIGLDEIVRTDDNLYFHAQRVQEAREKVVGYLKENGEITVSQFKELLGNTSRKYALPLLLHFDGEGVTQRSGDVRVLGSLK